MPSIRKELVVSADLDTVWSAFRDIGAVHRALAPGFVVNCKLEDDGAARIVTFSNGLVAREVIVDLDDAAHRLAYAISGGRLSHHNASFQVFAEGPGGSRVVWQADLLPAEMAPAVDAMMDQGVLAMQRRFDGRTI
ncbi:MAG: SRPBCC family protein [Ferrovibrio sp.]